MLGPRRSGISRTAAARVPGAWPARADMLPRNKGVDVISKRFSSTTDDVIVTFTVDRRDARSVEWVAEINDWEPVAMKRSWLGFGPFRLRVRLPKDREIQFRYRIDGEEWTNDEAADDSWTTDEGFENSVVRTFEG